MNIIKQPTKQQVRDWMRQRQLEHTPVPGMEQIRRELGWDFIQSGCNSTRAGRRH